MEKLIIPPPIAAVIEKIEQHGFEAWLVGGCVRDMLRGQAPHDYDIASNAPCEAICAMFERVIMTGIKHGTVTVISDGEPVEVTRYRIDGDYADHRRPDSVEFTGNFCDDLSRRDFTVNSIGFSPTRGIFDPFGGRQDIENGVLRSVGDAEKRFDEDALRIMRAVRFASTLGYEIEKDTLRAAVNLAYTLQNVSAERIYSELKKTLCGHKPSLTEILIKSGGLSHIGLSLCGSLSLLDNTDNNLNVRLAALIVLCNANPHEIMQKLKSDKATRAAVIQICSILNICEPLDRVSLKRLMANTTVDDLHAALTAQAVLFGRNTAKAKTELSNIVTNNEPYLISHLNIDGNQLEQMGLQGKVVGETLLMLLEKVLADPQLNTADKLKNLIDRH